MNVAKWLLLALLALPIMELAVFIAVAGAIGFLWALALVAATSLAGAMVLRHAGGNHIARVRVAKVWAKAASPPCKPTAPGP